MICLAVNTANTLLSVALSRDGAVLWHFESTETRDQGNLLLQQAKQGLAGAGLGFSDLRLLAVTTGPGSFTGIRIGLAAMRGLSLAAKVPVLGVELRALCGNPRRPCEYRGARILAGGTALRVKDAAGKRPWRPRILRPGIS